MPTLRSCRAGRRPAVCIDVTAVWIRCVAVILVLAAAVACGGGSGSPTRPGPPSPPPPPPPVNGEPVIESIAIESSRRNAPAGFVNVSDVLQVSASVRDAETPLDGLQYVWTSTSGTFTGTGARVSWRAPDSLPAPTVVNMMLQVVERYGSGLEHRVTRTTSVTVRDSAREVGDMARQFLIDFSSTATVTDWRRVMQNFSETACPVPREYQDEREQVENHYTNFVMHRYDVGPATVTVNFGGSCFAGLPGDACISIPVLWDSTDRRNNARRTTTGVDHLTAVFSAGQSRWWLCSSRFQGASTFGHAIYAQ